MRLTKAEKTVYTDCLGHCSWCFYEGGCPIEVKLKKEAKKNDGR